MKVNLSFGHKAVFSSLSKLNIELKILLLQKLFSLVYYLRMLHKNWKLSFIIIILLCWTMIDFVGLCLTLFDFLKLCWTLLIFVWLCLTLFEFDNLCLTLVNLRSYAQILCLFLKELFAFVEAQFFVIWANFFSWLYCVNFPNIFRYVPALKINPTMYFHGCWYFFWPKIPSYRTFQGI